MLHNYKHVFQDFLLDQPLIEVKKKKSFFLMKAKSVPSLPEDIKKYGYLTGVEIRAFPYGLKIQNNHPPLHMCTFIVTEEGRGDAIQWFSCGGRK